MARRHPLTGTLSVEWVDAANPDDDTVPPDFGWLRCDSDPPLDAGRLLVLLRELVATLEEEILYNSEDPWLPPRPPKG